MAPPGENGALKTSTLIGPLAAARRLSSSHSAKSNLSENKNFKNLADRIQSFDSWSLTFIRKEDLAAAGFYYLQKDDTVKCAFCGLEIGCWEEGDVPLNDHKRWAPSCPFVRAVNYAKERKIPIEKVKISNDVCGIYNLEIRPYSCAQKEPELEEHITKYKSPVYPQYVSIDERLKSFSEWPKSLHPEPQQLVDAGFWYSGKSDETFCFHCGGGLRDWDPVDDPMVEHEKWYPQCVYVLLNKAKDTVPKPSKGNEQLVSSLDFQKLCLHSDKEVELTTEKSSSTETKDKETSTPVDEQRLCKVCFQQELGVVTLPCSHLVTCSKCAPSLTTCPVCREPFSALVRVYW